MWKILVMLFFSKFKVTCGLKTSIRPHGERKGGKPNLYLQICSWSSQESGQIHSRKSGISKTSWRTEDVPESPGEEPLWCVHLQRTSRIRDWKTAGPPTSLHGFDFFSSNTKAMFFPDYHQQYNKNTKFICKYPKGKYMPCSGMAVWRASPAESE